MVWKKGKSQMAWKMSLVKWLGDLASCTLYLYFILTLIIQKEIQNGLSLIIAKILCWMA